MKFKESKRNVPKGNLEWIKKNKLKITVLGILFLSYFFHNCYCLCFWGQTLTNKIKSEMNFQIKEDLLFAQFFTN